MTMKNPCATCGGTGQIGYFQGESRFLLTWEECPRCCGTGLSGPPAADQGKAKGKPGGGRNRSRKKQGQ